MGDDLITMYRVLARYDSIELVEKPLRQFDGYVRSPGERMNYENTGYGATNGLEKLFNDPVEAVTDFHDVDTASVAYFRQQVKRLETRLVAAETLKIITEAMEKSDD